MFACNMSFMTQVSFSLINTVDMTQNKDKGRYRDDGGIFKDLFNNIRF